jgi:hypothetical protein
VSTSVKHSNRTIQDESMTELALNTQETADPINERIDAVRGNLDFVSVPTEELNHDGGYARELQPKLQNFRIWWMDDERFQNFVQTRQLSVSVILKVFGVHLFKTVDSAAGRYGPIIGKRISIAESDLPTSPTEMCSFMGMITDTMRFLVHAGRIDVAESLLSILDRVLLKLRDDSINKHFYNVFQISLECLQKCLRESFCLNRTSNRFFVLFHWQTVMFIQTLYYEGLFGYLSMGTNSTETHDFEPWRALMKNVASLGTPTFSTEAVIDMDQILQLLQHVSSPPAPQGFLESINNIQQFVQDCWKIYCGILKISSIRMLIDSILFRTMEAGHKLLQTAFTANEGQIVHAFKGIYLLSIAVFAVAEFSNLYFAVERILREIETVTFLFPLIDLLLCPTIAACSCFASTMKMYQKACSRLESAVTKETNKDTQPPKLARLSELLWSQILQLRALLPTNESDTSAQILFNLTFETKRCHESIANYVALLEIYPRHISLDNDWNIILAKQATFDPRETIRKKSTLPGKGVHKLLMEDPQMRGHYGNSREFDNKNRTFGLSKCSLVLRSSRGEPSKLRSSLPHCILLLGPILTSIELSFTGLYCLPHHFGRYFPNLKVSTNSFIFRC